MDFPYINPPLIGVPPGHHDYGNPHEIPMCWLPGPSNLLPCLALSENLEDPRAWAPARIRLRIGWKGGFRTHLINIYIYIIIYIIYILYIYTIIYIYIYTIIYITLYNKLKININNTINQTSTTHEHTLLIKKHWTPIIFWINIHQPWLERWQPMVTKGQPRTCQNRRPNIKQINGFP